MENYSDLLKLLENWGDVDEHVPTEQGRIITVKSTQTIITNVVDLSKI